MKTSTLMKLVTAGSLLFQFETVLGNNLGSEAPKTPTALSTTTAPVYKKIFEQLTAKKAQINKESLKLLGPGVTGGGDSCEQKVAYSYAFLLQLIEKDKIPASEFRIGKEQLLEKLSRTQFAFDYGLEQGRPVEAVNIPGMNAVLLDRAICNNDYEPLSYYAPLLMHEALRLAGMQEADTNYDISKNYIGLIRREADIELNSKRNFRIISNTASGAVAVAWGMGGKLLNFEELDKLSEDEQADFFQRSEAPLENYLVDLKRMKIISVIGNNDDCGRRDTAPDGNCAWAELNQRLNYNWESFSFHFEPYSNIGFRMFNSRDWAWIESIYALNSKQELIGECSKDCDKIIEKAVEASLTPAQKKELRNWLVSYSYRVKYSNAGAWEIFVNGSDHDSADGYHLKSTLNLEFVKGRFKATVGKFKEMSQEEYLDSLPKVSN